MFQLIEKFLSVFAIFLIYGVSNAQEQLILKVDTSNDLIKLAALKQQYGTDAQGRGIVSNFIISKGMQGIQSIIDQRKKRFTSEYSFGITNESFYKTISTVGQFDPAHITFNGFTLIRIKGDDQSDTALIAHFAVDLRDNKATEIINNGLFNLYLDNLEIRSLKAKSSGIDNTVNMDFEISLTASFLSNGTMNTDVPIGKFFCSVRNAPVDSHSRLFINFKEKLNKEKISCEGKSFLIPRSEGYYLDASTKKLEKCFGYGIFSIKVDVRESTKNSFIDKMIIDNKQDILQVGEQVIRKKFEKN